MAAHDIVMGAAGASSGSINYVDDVFSTYLYTGTGANQTITNGIDLAGKGGMVWFKRRNAVGNNTLSTTGITGRLLTDTTGALNVNAVIDSYNSNGFTTVNSTSTPNQSGGTFASWTFRKQPKFFDVVTYTGNGTARTIAHNLGSVPGMIIIKRTDTTGSWIVYHRGAGGGVNPETYNLVLNTTAAQNGSSTFWNSTAPTSSVFSIGSSTTVNTSDGTYVAYLFAHNAGGFGAAGTDNVISCGTYTQATGGVTVNLGFEPQYLLVKAASSTGNWVVVDNMRALNMSTTNGAALFPNLTNAETNDPNWHPTATGFIADLYWADGTQVIYMAIRRPMKPPTSGTEVFNLVTRAGTSAVDSITGVGFSPDSCLIKNRGGGSSVDWCFNFFDRLRNPGYRLSAAFTNTEDTSLNFITSIDQDGITLPSVGYTATNGGYNYINYFFKRAPTFFDEVCNIGGSSLSNQRITHNLTVAPELIILKARNADRNWQIYHSSLGVNKWLWLNATDAVQSVSNGYWGTAVPTATDFGLNVDNVGISGQPFVAYLFASCPGVSKVGSYTGNGSSQTINCGFAGGARFVMIKQTDGPNDWYVFDTARGIISANEPTLALNATWGEYSTWDQIDPDSSGFIVNENGNSSLNTSGKNYIYLAIA